MTIHSGSPFPVEDDLARRLRGRLGGAVSIWTTGAPGRAVGLTVSSFLISPGEPALAVGLLDPDSELAEALREPGCRFVIGLLRWRHRDLAEQFAGRMPAPGGTFRATEFEYTEAGPRIADADTWAECTMREYRELGWNTEVVAQIDRIQIGEDDEALEHRRGRYRISPG